MMRSGPVYVRVIEDEGSDRDGEGNGELIALITMRGMNFMVVPVCRPEEWDAAEREGREPDAIPWRAADVKVRSGTLT
jgi:hypothetical protein